MQFGVFTLFDFFPGRQGLELFAKEGMPEFR
jgi:hypothetical protein